MSGSKLTQLDYSKYAHWEENPGSINTMPAERARRIIAACRERDAEIERLKVENAALLRQWNELDMRNEQRHRDWNARLAEAVELLRESKGFLDQVAMSAPWHDEYEKTVDAFLSRVADETPVDRSP